jgi:hypothetical protein
MEEKIVKPVTSASQAPANQVPLHEQPRPENQRAIPNPGETDADAHHAIEQIDPAATDDQGKLIPQDYYLTSPLFHEVAQFFGLKSGEFDTAKNKLSVIVDWAIEKSGSNKSEDVLMAIREMENRILKPGWDEKRYDNLYKYVRLAAQKTALEKAMNAYERWGGYRGK